jgi:hypothetical protein
MAKDITPRGAVGIVERTRGKPFTAKQKKFLVLFAQNNFQDVKTCAQKAGYKVDYWSVINGLKEDIREIAENILVSSAPQAALTLNLVMDSEKPVAGAQNKLVAAKEILDRVGIVKTEKIEHNVSGGLFLLPAKTEYVKVEEQEYVDGEWEETE